MNPQAIATLVIAVACFAGGWLVEGWRMSAEIIGLKAEQKAAESRTAQQNLADLIAARRRGDMLQRQLTDTESRLDAASQEKNDAVRRLSVGRRCLDSSVVRVLERPAGLKPSGVPTPPGEPDASDARFATDTDVGLWIVQCKRAYQTCQGRLGAIANFYEDQE